MDMTQSRTFCTGGEHMAKDTRGRGVPVRQLKANAQSKTTLRDFVSAGVSVISVDAAAQILGISRNLAYQMAREGNLPTLRLGRKLAVPVSRLAQMLGEEGQ
jgi:excisionase family DNA binding protein